MSKLTILIDMDDTIENLCEAWVGYLNNKMVYRLIKQYAYKKEEKYE